MKFLISPILALSVSIAASSAFANDQFKSLDCSVTDIDNGSGVDQNHSFPVVYSNVVVDGRTHRDGSVRAELAVETGRLSLVLEDTEGSQMPGRIRIYFSGSKDGRFQTVSTSGRETANLNFVSNDVGLDVWCNATR